MRYCDAVDFTRCWPQEKKTYRDRAVTQLNNNLTVWGQQYDQRCAVRAGVLDVLLGACAGRTSLVNRRRAVPIFMITEQCWRSNCATGRRLLGAVGISTPHA